MDKSIIKNGNDVSSILKNLKNQASSKELEIIEVLSSFYNELKKVPEEAKEKITDTATAVDESVHKYPYYFIGGSAVVGFLLGFLSHRR